MAQYTFLTEIEINAAAESYGLGEVISYKVLEGGSENTNYLIKTKNGEYVVSICEQKTKEEALLLTKVLSHLSDYGFNTSKALTNKNQDWITIYHGKPFMIKEYVVGQVLDDIPEHLVRSLGCELGRLHQIPPLEMLPNHLSYGKEHFHEVAEYADGSDFHLWLQNVEEYIQPFITKDLTTTLIHGDVFCNNVIVHEIDQSLTIIDFEEATNYYRIFDIGMTIIGCCKADNTIDTEKIIELLKGYSEIITLTEQEIKSLKAFTAYAGAAMTFWRHKNFNFTKPDPRFFNHFIELKKRTDDVMSLPDTFFYNILN